MSELRSDQLELSARNLGILGAEQADDTILEMWRPKATN